MAEAPSGHESSAINVPRVLVVTAIVALAVVVIVTAIRLVVGPWVVPQHAQVVARSAPIPPTPRLQPHPDADLAELREQKRTLLSTWAWSDPAHNFARIPIDRAMALYVEQHAPSIIVGVAKPDNSAP